MLEKIKKELNRLEKRLFRSGKKDKQLEELQDKLKWYKMHNLECAKIARAGYERGRKQHTFSARIQQIFNIVRKRL